MKFEYVDDFGSDFYYEASDYEVKKAVKQMLFRYMNKSRKLDKKTVYEVLDYLFDDCDVDAVKLVDEYELAEELRDKAVEENRERLMQERDDYSDYESGKGVVYGRI